MARLVSHRGLAECASAARTAVDGFPICVSGRTGAKALFSDERDAAFAFAVECFPDLATARKGRAMAGKSVSCDEGSDSRARIATAYGAPSRSGGVRLECEYESSDESRRFLLALGSFFDDAERACTDDARSAVEAAGLFDGGAWEAMDEDVGVLASIVERELVVSSAADPHVCAMGMSVSGHPRVETDASGKVVSASVRVRGSYFDDREGVTLHPDGFIGMCGWADSRNATPFAMAVMKWAGLMAQEI